MPSLSDKFKDAGLLSKQELDKIKVDAEADKLRKALEAKREFPNLYPTDEQLIIFFRAYKVSFPDVTGLLPALVIANSEIGFCAMMGAVLIAENRPMSQDALVETLIIYRRELRRLRNTSEGIKAILFS